jgi:transposase
MYIAMTGSKNNPDVYVMRSFRKPDGKTTSRIYRKLGKKNELLKQFDGDEDAFSKWAKEEAAKDTRAFKEESKNITVTLSQTACIPKGEERCFPIGYLFLQAICTELGIDKICRKIRDHRKIEYDLDAVMTDLIYARILSPSSKRSSYDYAKTLLEPPKYTLDQVYRSLSVMAGESDLIQEELYRNSNFIHPRNTQILYYDCTNYYFEIEAEDGIKKYGKSKENRPNPIVTMGLFMDADGIPLAFDIFPGNQNEQTTLKPLETKIIRDYECSEFIYCSDAGLGSAANRRFNSLGNRSYVITHSLKKMKKEDQEAVLDPATFKSLGSEKHIDLRTLDEEDPEVYDSIYYKILPTGNKDTDEMLIVTYSPKYRAYQRRIRAGQIERAQKLIDHPGRKRRGKTQNDPARFIKKSAVTKDGEIAEGYLYDLDTERIEEEQKYDGFYAVVTNIDDDIREILKINRRRWEIEENFRIMKTEFEARPVYVRREDRIRAHFLICYISLLVYRLLEQKLKKNDGTPDYTCRQILDTLSDMKVTLLTRDSGYIPSYKRTDLTDRLHQTFGFRTDNEFITKSRMRSIIKNTKLRTEKKKI